METNNSFAHTLDELQARLFDATGSLLSADDRTRIDAFRSRAAESQLLQADAFGRHPFQNDLETAILFAQEMSHSRTAILAILSSSAALCGAVSIDEIKQAFGNDVARIVGGIIRIRDLYAKSATVENENFRSLFVTFSEDVRVILIMIANRVNKMRAIKDSPMAEARRKVSMEAAYLYAPLAHKLGLYKLKSELEDLSLKYLETEAYYHIKEKLNETKKSRDAYINTFITPIEEKLSQAGLKFHIKGRTKSIHSIWQKMKKQKVGVDGVYDLFAIRVILESEPEREKMDCWQAFSIITDMYQSNPKRMRDWLSVPKSNGYESLHITVLGPNQKWVEVQIRTERMDDIAEHGMAAHWRYKGVAGDQSGVDGWLSSVRAMLESSDDMQLMDQFRKDLVADEVFVFTPTGDLFKLPMGATVLDFAYTIHTKVGDRCIGARINSKNVTIRQQLQSGDQVEILTHKNQTPKQDWLNIVVTSRARSKIRLCLKEMQSKQAAMAREELERKMANRKLTYDEATFMHMTTRMGYKVVTDFYTAIANGTLSIAHVLETYAAAINPSKAEADTPTQSASQFEMQPEKANKQRANDDVLVIDQNLKGIDFQMAKCCTPVYGDDVFGFVTNGGGIKIHRTDCPNAPQMQQRFGYRIVRAKWAGKRGTQYPITLQVVGNDDLGIINNLTSIISKEEKINLRSISIDSSDGLFSGRVTVMLEDTNRLQSLVKKLKTIKGIKNVYRI